jgi:hypothetical protein
LVTFSFISQDPGVEARKIKFGIKKFEIKILKNIRDEINLKF